MLLLLLLLQLHYPGCVTLACRCVSPLMSQFSSADSSDPTAAISLRSIIAAAAAAGAGALS